MATKTEEAARASTYDLFIAPKPYSFELNMEMLEILRKEADPLPVVARFAEAVAGKSEPEVAKIAGEIFGEYGRTWMKRTLQLGEEYPDRTYEMLRLAADETGELGFPLILQRFVEIAYLGTQTLRRVPIIENWARRLVYQVPDCLIYKALSESCGAVVAERLPCGAACLQAAETACRELGLDAVVNLEASTPKDRLCQFAVNRL